MLFEKKRFFISISVYSVYRRLLHKLVKSHQFFRARSVIRWWEIIAMTLSRVSYS